MVHVDFIDNTSDDFETDNSINAPWKYQKEEQCFLIHCIDGKVMIPAAFIKCLKHYELEKYKEE